MDCSADADSLDPLSIILKCLADPKTSGWKSDHLGNLRNRVTLESDLYRI